MALDDNTSRGHSEREAWLEQHLHPNWFCGENLKKIDNDSSLSYSEKEALKQHLRIYGD